MANAKWPGYVTTKAVQLPARCPSCWATVPTRTSEAGGITRLACACGWSERYLVVDRA